MNEKQERLLRYFVRHTGNHQKAEQLRKVFDLAGHRTKGKITTWLKKTVVTMMALEMIRQKDQEAQLRAQLAVNLKTLEGFGNG